jgi:hypothetical protein
LVLFVSPTALNIIDDLRLFLFKLEQQPRGNVVLQFCSAAGAVRDRLRSGKELQRKYVQQRNSLSCFLYNSVYVKETEQFCPLYELKIESIALYYTSGVQHAVFTVTNKYPVQSTCTVAERNERPS